MFFQFERENNVNQNNVADLKLTLVEVGTGMAKFALEPGFGRYFDPIFAWGELALRPIMVTTDVDGKDSICVLTVPDDSESGHLQIREDTVIVSDCYLVSYFQESSFNNCFKGRQTPISDQCTS